MRKRPAAAIVTGVIAVVIVVGTLAPGAGATSHRRIGGSLTGTWSGTYGGAYHGTFTLHWTQSKSRLTGTINLSSVGLANITGNVRGSTISFGTVGNRQAITYSGSVSGTSMSGSYKAGGAGGSWSAHKK
jgi:subtilisin family serine protease